MVPDEGYLKRCQELLRKHNALLIADEVQTGLCRWVGQNLGGRSRLGGRGGAMYGVRLPGPPSARSARGFLLGLQEPSNARASSALC